MVDCYMSSVPGCLEHTFGREQNVYSCRTIIVYCATGKVFNFCQLSNNAAKTVWNTHKLEKLACDKSFTIKLYHSYNMVFATKEFKDDCKSYDQAVDFNGVGTQHQDQVAEHNIKIIASWTCVNMLHLAFYTPQHTLVKLWLMVINYTVWMFNHLL